MKLYLVYYTMPLEFVIVGIYTSESEADKAAAQNCARVHEFEANRLTSWPVVVTDS